MLLDAARLRSALVGVFEGRRQQGLPDRLPPPPTNWAVPYRKLVKEVGADLRAGYADAAALLDPVLADHAVGRWDLPGAFVDVIHRSKSLASAWSGLAPPVRSCRQPGWKPIFRCLVCSAQAAKSLCPILCPT